VSSSPGSLGDDYSGESIINTNSRFPSVFITGESRWWLLRGVNYEYEWSTPQCLHHRGVSVMTTPGSQLRIRVTPWIFESFLGVSKEKLFDEKKNSKKSRDTASLKSNELRGSMKMTAVFQSWLKRGLLLKFMKQFWFSWSARKCYPHPCTGYSILLLAQIQTLRIDRYLCNGSFCHSFCRSK
jgi:hypothetical protein